MAEGGRCRKKNWRGRKEEYSLRKGEKLEEKDEEREIG